MSEKLFNGKDDLMASVDAGIKLIMSDLAEGEPAEQDKESLKALLAIFITATIEMDPKAFLAPDLNKRLQSVRAALMTAYNLGRRRQ